VARSNLPRDNERRQRDQSHRRGDYGAPDAEGRQSRPYDRFSHSSASYTKEGGRPKKGGAGPRNWGEKDIVVEAPLDETKVEEEAHDEKVEEVVAVADGEKEGEKVEESEKKEEEDKVRNYFLIIFFNFFS
jgi:hypothetical protein